MSSTRRNSSCGRRAGAGKRLQVGILLDLEHHFGREIARGIHRYRVQATEWDARLFYGPQRSRLADSGCGAWIVQDDERTRAALAGSQAPVVGICGHGVGCPWPRIDVDHELIGERAAAHLLRTGRRSFAATGPMDQAWARRRLDGFARGLATAGVVLDPAHVRQPHAIRELLTSLPRPVGVFAVNDWYARLTADACLEAGVPVPGDVAILGCDDDDLQCQLSTPSLSSVAIPWSTIGASAAELLSRLLAGDDIPRLTVVSPLGVVERQSTLIAAADPRLAKALAFIREHASDGIGPATVARAVGIPLRTLEDAFHRHLHQTLSTIIRHERLDAAATLLRGSQQPVATIAHRCGFASAAHFAAAFKARFRCSPRSLRGIGRRSD